MKRTANNVALETLLYTMSPRREIKVIDCDYNLVMMVDDWASARGLGEYITVDNLLHNYRYTRYAKAQVRRLDVSDNCLVVAIDTEKESY